MAINVKWADESQSAIVYELKGKWTWDELFIAIDEAVQLLDSINHSVNIIIDVSESQYTPPLSVANLRRVANAPTMSHPNTQLLILVGANQFIKIMFQVFSRLFPHAASRYRMMKTLEEALSVVAKP